MKTNRVILTTVLVPLLFGTACGPGEERVKEMIAEEMKSVSEHSYFLEGEPIGPYSPAVRAGGFLFVSGQIGLDPETGAFPSDDMGAQTAQALRNLGRILSNAGLDSSNVVQCTVFLTDLTAFTEMNLVYGGFFTEDRYPARTTVEVRSLPRDAKVEIAAVAFMGVKD